MSRSPSRWLAFLESASAWLTWGLVIAVPIAVSLSTRRILPKSPFLAIGLGMVAFATMVVLAEGIWRVLRWLLTAGRAAGLPAVQPSAEERTAVLIARVLRDERTTWAEIEGQWPAGSENPLLHEANALLRACLDSSGRRFNAQELDRRLPELSDVMNRLRAERTRS